MLNYGTTENALVLGKKIMQYKNILLSIRGWAFPSLCLMKHCMV